MRFRSASLATLVVALSLPAFGQLGKIKDKISGKQPAEDPAKNQLRYEALKQYATDKYQKDLNFRDDVDQAYEEVMRQHSQRAYDRNTSVSSYIATVREDRWRIHENLYDNLVVQDHINRIGQKLVPPESERALAFKVIPDPTPLAETLSTGTVYVSTGLISIVDSESQLAYVLAHEMAHVMLDHWKERVILDAGQKVYADEQAAKQARFTFIAGLMGAGLGAATGLPGSGIGGRIISANQGSELGQSIGNAVGFFLYKPLIVNWDQVEEDAADDMAFKAVLNANYDVREVPTLYTTMLKVATRDARVGLGFLGSRRRVEQRMEKAKDLIAGAYKAEIDAKLKDGFLSSSAEHRNLMAELKRDNGIMAYYSDMFEMARKNLADALLRQGAQAGGADRRRRETGSR
jgi:predicted Zn-dependent protease